MSSVLRSVRKRKKGHTLGAVDVIDREEYAELEVDAKVELIRSLVPLGLMHIEELLDEEVTALAGERYARKAPSVGGRRHGSNPGTVGLAGHSARFITASDLLLDLNGQETARALERRLRHYARPALLAIDEIGYLAYDAHAADLLFQIVSRRYEHRPLLMTTNLAFKHWDTIFPNASCAVALIDRLTHHAEIVVIEGDSYRKREAELSQKQRRTKPKRR